MPDKNTSHRQATRKTVKITSHFFLTNKARPLVLGDDLHRVLIVGQNTYSLRMKTL